MRPETTRVVTRRIRKVTLAGTAFGVVFLLGGCSSSAKSSGSDTTTSSTAAAQTTTTVAPAPTPAPTTAPVTTAPIRSGGNGAQPTLPSPPSGPSPTVATFVTPDDIDCHNGNSQLFSASWTTTNAAKSTITIDGGGVYKTYGPNASASLPFDCSSPHTFVVTASAPDGRTATKSITLLPRDAQDTTSTTDPSTNDTTT
jgi:hypothetical protein